MSTPTPTIKPAKRTVSFDGKALADMPGLTPAQMKDAYAAAFPALETAVVEETVRPDGSVRVEFIKSMGSKGHGSL